MFNQNICIPFLLGVVIFLSCMLYLASPSSNVTDQTALFAFKSAIQFDSTNTILDGNWTKSTSFCDWVGVTCSRRRQRVTALSLSHIGLQGTISPTIANLSFLVSLDLSNNSFYGVLPNEINHLFRLRILKLQFNQLEGNIPASLHQCQKLEIIALSGNRFTGTIPDKLGILPKLRQLYLSLNNLVGTIPMSLSNISTLEILGLGHNHLTGSLPSAMFNISSLEGIGLTDNYISGILPSNICQNSPNVWQVLLSKNQLSGELPSGISHCKQLVALSLSYNRFHGSIPREIGSLQKLEMLFLGFNSLVGTIPSTIANMSMLKAVSIAENGIKGNVPNDLVRLPHVNSVDFSSNNFNGKIPWEIFNISTVQSLWLAGNLLSGNIPSNIGEHPNLEEVDLAANKLTGTIPSVFSNSSKLKFIEFAVNSLTGSVPTSLGHLTHLQYLGLNANLLTGEAGDTEIRFLTALSNCRLLRDLHLDDNSLNGTIPDSIGNYSSSLQSFTFQASGIRGNIPFGIVSLKNLIWLDLSSNDLEGNIPSAIGELDRLQKLRLDNNRIEGSIPEEFCHLRQLAVLSLQYNKITGSIPNCIGNISHLQVLLLSSNRLTSAIPMSLWSLKDLIFLNLSSNSLGGFIPAKIRKLDVIVDVDLSWNKIAGNIPSIIGAFESLSSLNLSKNLIRGPIPQSFGDLKGLESLDLSHNNLSGQIPNSLETLRYLRYLNLSFNKLSGEVPAGGPFLKFTADSFLKNEALCSTHVLSLPPCPSHSNQKSKAMNILLKFIIPGIASIIVFISVIYMLKKYRGGNRQIPESVNVLPLIEVRMISYQELRQATNNFNEFNLLGQGSFGSVYKGILSDRTTVAVKILNLQLEGAFRSFDAECEVLRAVRHRNLVKVMSSCSHPQLRALVLEYMSNGSLNQWLYSNYYCLNLVQRVSIMVDVGLAMEYLHHGQAEPILHCDLKPSNILLDEDLVAHVGDFGIAKILPESKDATQTKTLGTLGYIAPEYGSQGKVSTKADVYSYGVILMEIITGKKPVEEMFDGELSLRQWIAASLPGQVMGIVDAALLDKEDAEDVNIIQTTVLSMMELAMECTNQLAEERLSMRDVVVKLNKIKLKLQQRRTKHA